MNNVFIVINLLNITDSKVLKSKKSLSRFLGISYKTVYNRLDGGNMFTYDCYVIVVSEVIR